MPAFSDTRNRDTKYQTFKEISSLDGDLSVHKMSRRCLTRIPGLEKTLGLCPDFILAFERRSTPDALSGIKQKFPQKINSKKVLVLCEDYFFLPAAFLAGFFASGFFAAAFFAAAMCIPPPTGKGYKFL
jgi:hypothetical protein